MFVLVCQGDADLFNDFYSISSFRRMPGPSRIKHPDPGVRRGGEIIQRFPN